MKDQRNELKNAEARLLAKEQEQIEMENDIAKQSQEIPFFVNIINYLFWSGDIEGWRETEARARGLGSGDCSPVTDLEFVKQFTLAKLLIALDSTDKFHYNPVAHMDFFFNF